MNDDKTFKGGGHLHDSEAEAYEAEAREVARQQLTTDLLELSDIVGVDAVCQSMIDAFGFHIKAVSESHKWATKNFLCAVKECMIHKDSPYVGKGYIYEKVDKAMRELNMPIKEA
jgi:hypothetical protein